MKNRINFLVLICSLCLVLSCKKHEFYDLTVAGEYPFGKVSTEELHKTVSYDSVKAVVFKIPKLSEWNLYYKKKDKETFLTNYCIVDCNEEINKYEWSNNGAYFAMLIEGSNRYSTGTRLFLFDFKDDIVTRKVDVKDVKITSFRFEEKAFFYTNDKKEETKVNL